jgi:hypothetical protein
MIFKHLLQQDIDTIQDFVRGRESVVNRIIREVEQIMNDYPIE